MIVNSMLGLGDNIYQRQYIRRIREPVLLDTPWPEIYAGLDHVKFLPRQTNLRTQRKNIQRQPESLYHGAIPRSGIQVRYKDLGPLQGMAQALGMDMPRTMDMPDYYLLPTLTKPFVLVRPVTVRREWRAKSRNPHPAYLADAVQQVIDAGIEVISIADLEAGEEWMEGELPEGVIQVHDGSYNVPELMTLVQHALFVIAPVGWIVPACLAYKTPAWIICGGQGGFNHPDKIAPEPYRSAAGMHFAVPDNYCLCKEKLHECDKRITGHAERFASYLGARTADGVASRPSHRIR